MSTKDLVQDAGDSGDGNDDDDGEEASATIQVFAPPSASDRPLILARFSVLVSPASQLITVSRRLWGLA